MNNLPGSVHIAPNADRLYDDLGHMLLVTATGAVQSRGVFHLALSGGSTPEPFYMRLCIDPRFRLIPWAKTQLWQVDERRVPDDDDKRNMKMIRESLTEHIGIDPDQVHPMPVMENDPAFLYEKDLRGAFGLDGDVDGPPRLDLILLGMGDDCHTASLFPRSTANDVDDRWIVVNEGEHVTPPDRVTMTFPLINAARHVGVLVVGAKKHEPLQRVSRQRAIGPDRVNLPISAIDPASHGGGNLTWYLDDAAANG